MSDVKISEMPHSVATVVSDPKQLEHLRVMLANETILLDAYAEIFGFRRDGPLLMGTPTRGLPGGSPAVLGQSLRVRCLQDIIAASER